MLKKRKDFDNKLPMALHVNLVWKESSANVKKKQLKLATTQDMQFLRTEGYDIKSKVRQLRKKRH